MVADHQVTRSPGRRVRLVAAAAVLCVCVRVFAHGGAPAPDAAEVFWNAVTAVVLTAGALLYGAGLLRLWRFDAGRQVVTRWRAAAYYVALGSAAVALLSPIDRWSDVLFSMHMAQHEILMLISAPCFILGRPFVVTLWALSARLRERVAEVTRDRRAVAAWELSTGALTVLVLHAVVLWGWHVPRLFELALHNETVHVVQHLGFFLTAALFWWALIHGRYGRIGYGIGVMYVFATAMHTQILGALLTFGGRGWYPTHIERTLAAGIDPLQDQQFAGIVMWIPFGVIFVFIALALFAAWLGEAERRVVLGTAASASQGERR